MQTDQQTIFKLGRNVVLKECHDIYDQLSKLWLSLVYIVIIIDVKIIEDYTLHKYNSFSLHNVDALFPFNGLFSRTTGVSW